MKHNCILCEIEQITDTTIHDIFTYCDTCTNYYGLYNKSIDSNALANLTDTQKAATIANDMLFVLSDSKSTNLQKQTANKYLVKTLKRSKDWIDSHLKVRYSETVNPLFWN